MINKNNFYMIPKYIIAAVCSNTRGGKYTANKTEIKNNYYFKLNIPGINQELKIPFKAILKDNNKLKGIKAINFSTATHCSSHKKGLCQIKNISDCYAYQGEKRAKNYLTGTGSYQVNSIFQIELTRHFIQLIKNDKKLFNNFIKYLNKNVKILRYNVNGDFIDATDINLLINISKKFKGPVYGYTARDDLEKNINKLAAVAAVNGSNKKYTNKYTATYSLETFFKACCNSTNCKGNCINCKKCWTFQDKEIVNLFHKKDADIILNTWNNRQFIIKLLNAFNVNIKDDDLKKYKGIFYSINQYFKKEYDQDLKNQDINNIKEFIEYTATCSHYDIQDNIELYNREALQELTLC